MRRPNRIHAALPLLAIWIAFTAAALAADAEGRTLSSPRQLQADAQAGPCLNADRFEAVRKLFERMGADSGQITIDRFKSVQNISIRKPGHSEELIVVGAHYDKVSAGCGALDNWSGIATVAHLYRTVRDSNLGKTVIFEAFGDEEEGLVGSKAMVHRLTKTEASRYCAMINLDSLGMGIPQIAEGLSSEKLVKLTARLAADMKVPFSSAVIPGADADSVPFEEKGIPAVTIHGLPKNYQRILHSPNDQPPLLNLDSLYQTYRVALALLTAVEAAPCNAWR